MAAQSQQTSIIESVVSRVAEAENVDPVELPPLYNSIDPDAFDSLLNKSRQPLLVSFGYCRYEVIIFSKHGEIDITLRESVEAISQDGNLDN